MGITQQIGASSLIKPGVIDNTAARPASPYEGQVIFQKDTDQLLVWNGTAWVIPNSPAQNPQGLELVTTTTCSSGGTATGGVVTIGSGVASVAIGNAFSANYDNYRITVTGMLTSANNMQFGIQFGNDSGHRYAGWWMPFTGTTMTNSYSNAATYIPTGWAGSSSNYKGFTAFDVFGPFLVVVPRVVAPWSGAAHAGHISGLWADTTSITGFTILPDSGTITGGTIRVYGYRNS
jgi:hypothetical protein